MKIWDKYKKRITAVLAVFIVAASLIWGYWQYASPTKIYLVNYPEYILAPLLDQELNSSLDIRHLKWTGNSGSISLCAWKNSKT